MKWIRMDGCVAAIAMLFAGAAVAADDLVSSKTVYILPMSNGLDQFLAIKLTGDKAMQVVTDPQKADTIFTDRIGEAFEQRLDELYGPKPKSDANDKDKDTLTSAPARISSGIHAKGTIFLVDRRTRAVVWSTYVKTRSAAADEMNHAAEQIVSRLEKDRKTNSVK